MRVSVLLCVLLVAALALVSFTSVVADDSSDWIQPAFVESETAQQAPTTGSWQAVRDPKSGRTYWYNTTTKKTSWIDPTKPLAPSNVAARDNTRVAPRPTPLPAGGFNTAPAGGPIRQTPKNLVIPADILALGRQFTKPGRVGPLSNAHARLSTAQQTQILTALWKAFGATAAQLPTLVSKNLKQIHKESSGCANIIQSPSTRDVNSRTDPAGGLVQFTKSTFSIWHVKGTPDNRLDPVSNLAAAINAQVHGDRMTACHTGRVLNGCSGWSPSSNKALNPYRA